MLRHGWVCIRAVEIGMARLKLAQKIPDAFVESVVICRQESGALLVDCSGPIRVIDIANVEVVLDHDGLDTTNDFEAICGLKHWSLVFDWRFSHSLDGKPGPEKHGGRL